MRYLILLSMVVSAFGAVELPTEELRKAREAIDAARTAYIEAMASYVRSLDRTPLMVREPGADPRASEVEAKRNAQHVNQWLRAVIERYSDADKVLRENRNLAEAVDKMESIVLRDPARQLLATLRAAEKSPPASEASAPLLAPEPKAEPAPKKKLAAKVKQPDGTWKEVEEP